MGSARAVGQPRVLLVLFGRFLFFRMARLILKKYIYIFMNLEFQTTAPLGY